MSYTCDSAAEKVAEGLGFSCHDRNPFASLRNPFDLENATMPFLELLIIGGAIWALVHSWKRWRRDGDPVGISLWFASLVYLAVVEPPLYFPGWFGLEEHVGFIFSHNVFTVQFMYDRLPLYIVAFYPAITTLAWEIVRALRVLERRGAIAAAFAVAFVCQVFYEIFDQLGPQLKWWAWNMDNRQINQPALDSVPMNSMLLFASVSFAAMAWLVLRFVGPRDGREKLGGGQVAWRTVVAGVLTPFAMMIVSAPTSAFRGDDQIDIQRTILWVELGIVWAIGLWLLLDAWRASQAGQVAPVDSPTFVRIYPALYLGVHVVLWASALPAYFAATDGITEDGTPVGSLWYVVACTLASLALIAAAVRATSDQPAREPVKA